MNSNRDPFGFETRPSPAAGTNPLIVVAQPGQELRIVIPEEDVGGGGFAGFREGSGSGGSGDTRVSSKGDSSDSRVSGKSDSGAQRAFGFETAQRGFTQAPITIVARPGQEIRVIVTQKQSAGGSGGSPGFSLDSRVSGPSKDQGRRP